MRSYNVAHYTATVTEIIFPKIQVQKASFHRNNYAR